MNKKTVRDIQVAGWQTLVRVDFNVPIKEGKVKDDTRIRASLPTIQYLIDQGAMIALCSHLGRPKGVDPVFSLAPVAAHLGGVLKKPVRFAADCVGPEAENAVADLKPGEVALLENTRFHPEEEKNDPAFAQRLAMLAKIYVDDAFGSAHRAHASTEGVAHYLPAVAGFLMEEEIEYLDRAANNPDHPYVVILGGAKISDKIGVIRNLLRKADRVLIGGGMANTFFSAKGYKTGDSLVEPESVPEARKLLEEAKDQLVLPEDTVIAQGARAEAARREMPVGDVPDGWRILDIGPRTVKHYCEALQGTRLVVWNGPMGMFEVAPFAKGTEALARAVASCGATTIVGGGDSVAAIAQFGLTDKITHISTGGGASLEFLEGRILPGVAVLQDR
ncbi:MAG: phosphoglycerate kinase [Anaerolineales bacterium]|jgi:phosphoglycerate kinase